MPSKGDVISTLALSCCSSQMRSNSDSGLSTSTCHLRISHWLMPSPGSDSTNGITGERSSRPLEKRRGDPALIGAAAPSIRKDEKSAGMFPARRDMISWQNVTTPKKKQGGEKSSTLEKKRSKLGLRGEDWKVVFQSVAAMTSQQLLVRSRKLFGRPVTSHRAS